MAFSGTSTKKSEVNYYVQDCPRAGSSAVFTSNIGRLSYQSKPCLQIQEHFSILNSIYELILSAYNTTVEQSRQRHRSRSTISELLQEPFAIVHLCTHYVGAISHLGSLPTIFQIPDPDLPWQSSWLPLLYSSKQ